MEKEEEVPFQLPVVFRYRTLELYDKMAKTAYFEV